MLNVAEKNYIKGFVSKGNFGIYKKSLFYTHYEKRTQNCTMM